MGSHELILDKAKKGVFLDPPYIEFIIMVLIIIKMKF